MVYITSRRFDMRSERTTEVKAYTNAGPAILVLNGVPVGAAAPIDHILRWTVRLAEGPNRLEVRSETKSSLSDEVVWTYRSRPTMLVPEHAP